MSAARTRRPRPAPSAHERELELKYALKDPDAVAEMLGTGTLAGLNVGQSRKIDVVDRYLDTASRALERAGYGARLRHVDHSTVLTVKSTVSRAARGKPAGALHDRLELEGRANKTLDPARWPQSGARALLEATVGEERVRTLFTLEQRREERELSRPGGTVVAKMSLDEAEVKRFGRSLGSFWTLEVESTQSGANGSSGALEAIAAELESTGLLVPEMRSKEQIGLAMVGDARSARTPARPPKHPGVKADDTLAEAGRKVLRMNLLRMLEMEAGVRAGEDIEAVHRMRVATRRMRAAWRVFNGAYRKRLQQRYVRELRVVATALGTVRDTDVQLERIALYLKSLAGEQVAAIGPLVDEWRHQRGEARATLLHLLDSRDYDEFVNDYRSFVDSPGAGAVGGKGRRVVDAAGARIWGAYEQLRGHDVTVAWADVAALHALRIDGKRLRYTLEFFGEVLPQNAGRIIAEVTALQDQIGALNDAQIAADLTRTWLMDSGSQFAATNREAAGAYLEASEADVTRLKRTFKPLWRRVVGGPFRRRLALAIGSL